MRKTLILLLSAILILALVACQPSKTDTDSTNTTTQNNTETGTSDAHSTTNDGTESGTGEATSKKDTSETQETEPGELVLHDEADHSITHPDFTKSDLNAKWNSGDTQITLNKTTATVKGQGASVSGSVVRITSPGTYVISGTLNNGRIEIEVTKEENVQIVLNGVTISCRDYAPIYVVSANKTIVTLVKNTTNILNDGPSYNLKSGETKPNACLHSTDDLTINGTGKLIVNGFYNNGIGTSNDLKIVSGIIEVNAVNNALKGNDSVFIIGGDMKLICSNDGIKSDEEVKEGKGFVQIEGGKIDITAGGNGLQAINRITVTGGETKIKSTKAPINCDKVVEITDGTVI